MFQTFQAVKVTGEHPDAGRAGSIRGTVQKMHDYRNGETEPVDAQPVQLDGNDAPQLIALSNLAAL